MKYVIFDLDGTLLDTMNIWDNIDIKFLERYGKSPTPEVRDQVKKISVRQSAELFKTVYNLPKSVEKIVAEVVRMSSEEYARNAKLKPFVLEFLEHLKKSQTKMCVATAAPRQNALPTMERLDIRKYFEFILAAEDVKTSKEDPEIYLECCARFGAKPNEVTVFEDAVHAVKTAKNAGFRVIGVYDEFSKMDSTEIRNLCDAYVNHFGELFKKSASES